MQAYLNIKSLTSRLTFFERKLTLRQGILLILFLAALITRVNNFEAFQSGDRQFRSALIARAYYFRATSSIPEWRREVAEIARQRVGLLEPPIMELLVSWVYRLINREYLWVPGFLASVFWLIGGIFLYKIAEQVISVDGALVAVAYYLFVPAGISISTGFVPDPLMVMLFLLSIFMISRYYDQPSRSRVVIAAIIAGLAVLVKPFCLFALVGVFLSLAIHKKVSWKELVDSHLLTFLGILILPIVFYYLFNILTGSYLSKQAQVSFLPYLLLTRSYWKDWILTAFGVAGFVPLMVTLVGLPLLRPGQPRALLVGLLAGYVVFCLLFTYHIRFGIHYHTQLIIIVALCLGLPLTLITDQLRQLVDKYYWWLPVAGALLLVILFNFLEIRNILSSSSINYEAVVVNQEIGEIVNHSTQVVYLAPAYGMPLQYYGELSGAYWPRTISDSDRVLGIIRPQSLEVRFDTLNFIPEYFVITQFKEFNQHHTDLKEFLSRRCSLVADHDQYLIYGACAK